MICFLFFLQGPMVEFSLGGSGLLGGGWGISRGVRTFFQEQEGTHTHTHKDWLLFFYPAKVLSVLLSCRSLFGIEGQRQRATAAKIPPIFFFPSLLSTSGTLGWGLYIGNTSLRIPPLSFLPSFIPHLGPTSSIWYLKSIDYESRKKRK